MKTLNLLPITLVIFSSVFVILTGISLNCNSQKLTTGIMSGVNFSDIHGDFTKGKWQSKPGPVIGVFADYSFNNIISVQTGLDYSAVYFEYRPYRYPQSLITPWYGPGPRSSSSYFIPQQLNEKWDFSFFRVPLYLKLSTPTRLRFELAAGMYYSFVTKSETGMPDYYDNTPNNDYGYIFSAGFSYPVSPNLKLLLNGRYVSGKQIFIESYNAKNGATEISFGIGYSGILEKNRTINHNIALNDSSEHKVWIKYKGGLNVSWNGGDSHNNSYSAKPGFTAGISMGYLIDDPLSLQLDIMYEQKGFAMKDSSASYSRYVPEGNQMYLVDTKIDINYIVIPLLMNFRFGKKISVLVNFGPYVGVKLNARNTGIATTEYRSENNYKLQQVSVYDDIEGLIRNDDWGLVFGSGIGIPFFNKYRLDLEFKYSRGLVNIYEPLNSNVDNGNNDEIFKNQSLQLTAGFRVPLY